MTQILSGPGVPAPAPQNLYPSQLQNALPDAPTNYIGLPPGAAIYIPSGSNRWLYAPGKVSLLQYLDPVTGTWRSFESARNQPAEILDMTFIGRIANLTGCPVGAIVAGGGTGFAQGTAQITANVGGSTWQAVVGGALSVSTISAVGKNYTIAPEVFIPAPPTQQSNGVGGVQATAHTTIANGTVASVVLDNVGAGYPSAPTAVIVPSPFDVNVGTITQATVVLVLNAALAGSITAALCTNNGAPLSTISALTLTAAGGGGSGATITPCVMQTATAASVVAGGVGWGDVADPALVLSVGGSATSVSAIGNPLVELTDYRPRQATGVAVTNAGGTIASVVVTDPGLFVFAPSAAVVAGAGLLPSTAASVTWLMGALNDTVMLQPL